MDRKEAIRILEKMKTRCFPDELKRSIEVGKENEAIDFALVDMKICEANNRGWISVKEHLPPKSDEYTDYIVHIIDDEGNWAIGVAEWDCTLGVGTWRLGPDSVALPDGMYITHWMNTPEPLEGLLSDRCGTCKHYIGGGDWDLCCDLPHPDYPCGFLCYADTLACEKYERNET